MGNKHPKAEGKSEKKKGDKSKKGKGNKEASTRKVVEVQADEESTPFFSLEVIFEMKNGSTTGPESMNVDPNITLQDWKEDLKQLRNIQTAIAVRRDNRNDDLGPENLTLRALQIRNRDVFCYRECT